MLTLLNGSKRTREPLQILLVTAHLVAMRKFSRLDAVGCAKARHYFTASFSTRSVDVAISVKAKVIVSYGLKQGSLRAVSGHVYAKTYHSPRSA